MKPAADWFIPQHTPVLLPGLAGLNIIGWEYEREFAWSVMNTAEEKIRGQ